MKRSLSLVLALALVAAVAAGTAGVARRRNRECIQHRSRDDFLGVSPPVRQSLSIFLPDGDMAYHSAPKPSTPWPLVSPAFLSCTK